MAILIGGIGSSHAPSIAYAFDNGHQSRPEWQTFFESYHPVKAWLAEIKPDIIVFFYNDHLNRFQLDAYPTFALGMMAEMAVADEGRGPRPFPPVPGHPAFAAHLARYLVNDEFDLTTCQEMVADHGIMSILPLIADPPWPFSVVPIAVNVIVEPMPTPRRLYRIGQSVGAAIRASEINARVVVMSTGGLSHQLHGPSFGFVNPEWDNRFMDLLETDPEQLANATHADYINRGGAESVEMMVWLAMRGALGKFGGKIKRIQRNYYAPMLTGYGLLAYELTATEVAAD